MAQLTASTINQLVISSPGNETYCYAEHAIFFPSIGRKHREYSLHPLTKGGWGWVSWVAGYIARWFSCLKDVVICPHTTRLIVQQFH